MRSIIIIMIMCKINSTFVVSLWTECIVKLHGFFSSWRNTQLTMCHACMIINYLIPLEIKIVIIIIVSLVSALGERRVT